MLSFALILLSLYFFFIAGLSLRERPAVLNGMQDWMLLCGGVSGLFAFGPGKLLIPVHLYSFWGIGIWAFWFLFYILFAFILAKYFLPPRIVIYSCQPEIIISFLKKTGNRIEGNVLYIPEGKLQCSITGSRSGGFTVLTATDSKQDKNVWSAFEIVLKKELYPYLMSPVVPAVPKHSFFYWFFWGTSTALVSLAILIYNAKELLNCFFDYWC